MAGTAWTIETLSAVDAEIEVLPVALRARLLLLETVKAIGQEALFDAACPASRR